jgi:hypothetical protein
MPIMPPIDVPTQSNVSPPKRAMSAVMSPQ